MAAPTAEGSEAVTVSMQLTDASGANLANRGVVDVFVSTDANGDTPGDGSATIALTAGTDGALIGAAGSGAKFISEADGDLDVVLTDSAGATQDVYLHAVIDGVIVATSAACSFAA